MAFPDDILERAASVLDRARASGKRVAIAESCTGGLVTAALTEIPGSSDVVERGFLTYSNEAKVELLGVPEAMIAAEGAVSSAVAAAMVRGALTRSLADIALAVTGVAGPGGGTAEKPVGLVFIAAGRRDDGPVVTEHRFGDLGRHEIRMQSVAAGLALLAEMLS